jgi:hypothetical protein
VGNRPASPSSLTRYGSIPGREEPVSKVYVAPAGAPPPVPGWPIGTPDDLWELIGEGDVGGWTDGPAWFGGEAVLVAIRLDD